MDELEELTMIERQMKINDILTDKKIKIKSKKFLPELFNLLSDCIENQTDISDYIESKVWKQKWIIKWNFSDDDGNRYEVEWIHSQRLANLWINFDYKYTWSPKMGFYLNNLISYIRTRAWYTQFNITLLKK